MTSITWPGAARAKRHGRFVLGLNAPAPTVWAGVAVTAVAILASIAARPWLSQIGDTRYQEFLRMEWLLAHGGKALQLDFRSLPLAPSLFVLASLFGGPSAAEAWLPVLIAVAVVLVLTQRLLADASSLAKLLAAALVLGCPFFYLLQRQLDVQLFVLLFGLHLWALRAFRREPTAAHVTLAIAVNLAFAMTTFAAALVLAASSLYLVLMTRRQHEVEVAAWRALLWLYVPFSFAGYALWAMFWVVAGSRLNTSAYFTPTTAGKVPLGQFTQNAGGGVVLVLLLLLGAFIAAILLLRSRPAAGERDNRAVIWAAITCITVVLCLLGVESVFQQLDELPAVLTFSMVLLVPAAIGGTFGRVGDGRHRLGWASATVALGLGAALLVVVPLQYVRQPGSLPTALVPVASRATAERQAAAQFVKADPGGRVLLDPRYTATFVLAAHIDPSRLLTPFDAHFPRLVAAPPADVRSFVVTDSLSDDVAGNYAIARIADQAPEAAFIAGSKAQL